MVIVMLNGPAGAGKDYFADFLVEVFAEALGVRLLRIRMASPLADLVESCAPGLRTRSRVMWRAAMVAIGGLTHRLFGCDVFAARAVRMIVRERAQRYSRSAPLRHVPELVVLITDLGIPGELAYLMRGLPDARFAIVRFTAPEGAFHAELDCRQYIDPACSAGVADLIELPAYFCSSGASRDADVRRVAAEVGNLCSPPLTLPFIA